jgi:FAD dependent oxidoreductase
VEREPTNSTQVRRYRHEERVHDVLVVGGGMAGIAAAVTAARAGARVALVHDRPVLGGNASTEIRVNLEGANGGVHNRYFVESGLPEDLLLENLWRNPTGAADHWGALLLELVLETEGLDLHLDTHANAVVMAEDGSIRAVQALTLSSEREWTFTARLFVDATGDASIAFLAGAEFMTGEDPRALFDEPLAPLQPSEHKLGGTMQFMCKDAGRPVLFEPPSFARRVTAEELRVNRTPNVWTQDPVLGGFWWIEYGGHLDTIADNADIKLELLAEIYGIWDYVKNSPEWRQRNANLDLEWVAAMPGKRESRRVVGDHVLSEHDIATGARFDDAVAFGGWSIDNHPPRGFLDADLPPCTQVQPPGLYQIPLRALYARKVPNLFLAGRDISASHVACCSARVMLTCMSGGEAVGAAAAVCARTRRRPRDVAADADVLADVRQSLERAGHYVPYVQLTADRLPGGTVAKASSEAVLGQPEVTEFLSLSRPRMLSLPLIDVRLEAIALLLRLPRPARLRWRLHAPHPGGWWIPGERLTEGVLKLDEGEDWRELPLALDVDPGYVHLAVAVDDAEAEVGASSSRGLGPLSWRSHVADFDAVAVDRRASDRWDLPQQAEEDWGDSLAFPFSYWRRDGHGWGGPPAGGLAFRVLPVQTATAASFVLEPWERPTTKGVHAWRSASQAGRLDSGKFHFDTPQWLAFEFPAEVDADAVEIYLDSDVDRHLANIWYSHPPGMRAIPTLVADLDVDTLGLDGRWDRATEIRNNHGRRCSVAVGRPIRGFRVVCLATHSEPSATVMDARLREAR